VPRDWDQHYTDAANHKQAPEPLLVEVAELLPPGCALDLACGVGQNARYLASLGWRVTAVDRSRTAIEALRRSAAGLPVEALAVDLETGEFAIAPAAYDLVCDFFYLQRDLFPAIRAGVRPGGVFAAAIRLVDPAAARPMHPAFLLESGELRDQFEGWKILFYSEAREAGHNRRAARIIARRA
jgi:SAM-dependent methyltransferase